MFGVAHQGSRTVTVAEFPDPVLQGDGEAIVDIRFAGICGSDLWPYRGAVPFHGDNATGHEFIGVVREVGDDVFAFKPGDAVIAPFTYCDGTCDACRRGLQSLCDHVGLWGKDLEGAQAEAIRVPYADATLVALPFAAEDLTAKLARTLIPAADVFATGTHGAVLAEIESGDAVAVIGDGAVGISAAYAARRLNPSGRVILLGDNVERLKVAESWGIDTLTVSRDGSPVEAFLAINNGKLADRVIECVGMQAAFDSAIDLVRLGGRVANVGVPHGVDPIPPHRIFSKQIHLAGGVAPARHYLPGFIEEIARGHLDLSPLITEVYPLAEAPSAYAAMDSGQVLKAVLDVSR